MCASANDPTINCDFPNHGIGYETTSCRNGAYNCIAWAVGDAKRKWWPYPFKVRGTYWPSQIRCDATVDAFVEMFSKICGYKTWPDENRELEDSYEKVAIYVKNGEVTHAARQLPSGKWASKIGGNKDIEHDLEMLENLGGTKSLYGTVAKVMRRKRRKSPMPPVCQLVPVPHCKIMHMQSTALPTAP
jgi:hypothetical protein